MVPHSRLSAPVAGMYSHNPGFFFVLTVQGYGCEYKHLPIFNPVHPTGFGRTPNVLLDRPPTGHAQFDSLKVV